MSDTIAYIRVSTDDQVNGTSLDNQKKACQEYAIRNGMQLSNEGIFREEGVSAKLINRPQLALLLKYCAQHKGKVRRLLVWKGDRLARKTDYYYTIRAQLENLGVKIVSVTEPMEDDAAGRLMESMLAGFAQFENDIRVARTSAGMRARAQQGA